MIKISAVIVALLALGYAFLPGMRVVLTGLAPLAIVAICPISMMFMMSSMNKKDGSSGSCHDEPKKEQA